MAQIIEGCQMLTEIVKDRTRKEIDISYINKKQNKKN